MTQREDSFERLLNVGCGRCYHRDWTNVDLVAHGPEVQQYDLRRGLPYESDSFDGVYHSHVLEHLQPDDAREMLAQCGRVLREGGVLRVVVPDLEGIAKAYLDSIQAAESGDPAALANHHWMTLELIDQMVRQRVGGQMGHVMRDPDLINAPFVRSRIGGEMGQYKNATVKKTVSQRLSRLLVSVRKQIARVAVTLVDGTTGLAAYREGRFRQSGEIHRWMYDRISLAATLREVGFDHVRVCQADESTIPNFDAYQLDRDEAQRTRKPDSLFIEAIKVSTASQSAASPSARRVA
ncbi:MAG: methyltransferase domain-containing protein [Pirellulaceae bacterium]|nr:methyltransferase domain-containing protein [Pirellulaceae bacterium]